MGMGVAEGVNVSVAVAVGGWVVLGGSVGEGVGVAGAAQAANKVAANKGTKSLCTQSF